MGKSFESRICGGRIKTPQELEKFLSKDPLVICRGIEKALFVFQNEVWKGFGEKLFSYGKSSTAERTIRCFLGGAVPVTWNEGMLEIPALFMEFAGLRDGDMVELSLAQEEFERLVIRRTMAMGTNHDLKNFIDTTS